MRAKGGVKDDGASQVERKRREERKRERKERCCIRNISLREPTMLQ